MSKYRNLFLRLICTVAGVTVIVVLVMIFIVAWGGLTFSDSTQHLLVSSISPNRSYKLTIKYEDAFTFGSHKIHVYYNKDGVSERELFSTDLNNDGKSLDSNNYNIQWNNELVTLTLKGEEQADEIYILDMIEKKVIRHFEQRSNYKK